jgi:thioredoxin 1
MTVKDITIEPAQPTGLVVIDFYANWCRPCTTIAPKFAELSENSDYSKVTFCKANVDEAQGLASKYSIQSIPTFIIINNGTLFDRIVGADIKKLEESIKRALENNKQQSVLNFTK